MDDLSSGYTVNGIYFPYVNVINIFSVSLTCNLMTFIWVKCVEKRTYRIVDSLNLHVYIWL